MHVIIEYILLILMPTSFWSLGRESKVGGIPTVAILFFWWWYFSDVETPFVWPIATFLCTLGCWYALFKMYGTFADSKRSDEIAARIKEAQDQEQNPP